MLRVNTYITTVSGRHIDLLKPDPAEVRIADIAHALGFIARFGGHTPLFYSVAQHSVLVSKNVPAQFALTALLHDAAEFAAGDLPSPLKQLLSDLYKPIEERIQRAIHSAFGLPEELGEEQKKHIKHADLRALATEKRDLMWVDDGQWAMLDGIEPFKEKIVAISHPPTAIANFLQRFEELTGSISTDAKQ